MDKLWENRVTTPAVIYFAALLVLALSGTRTENQLYLAARFAVDELPADFATKIIITIFLGAAGLLAVGQLIQAITQIIGYSVCTLSGDFLDFFDAPRLTNDEIRSQEQVNRVFKNELVEHIHSCRGELDRRLALIYFDQHCIAHAMPEVHGWVVRRWSGANAMFGSTVAILLSIFTSWWIFDNSIAWPGRVILPIAALITFLYGWMLRRELIRMIRLIYLHATPSFFVSSSSAK